MTRLSGLLAALLFASVAHTGFANATQKFDAAITSVLTAGSQSANPRMAKAARDGSIPVLIKLDGHDASYLQAMGVQIRSQIGNIVSANVPFQSLSMLLAEDRVLYVEADRPMIGRLNVSVPATKANQLRSGTAPNYSGATGAGVIVGVIDDGIDFRHLDFRNLDGTTRLLGLWDQRVAGAAGSPPAGFAYGGECTPAMLNDAIGGNAAACTQPSSGNHGSHVGGIAAGNGQQTGNAQPAYRFVGMAPYADILAANSIGGGAGGNAVVDAIAWMRNRAMALGKPIVINLSLGSYFGARDGTSNFEQALSNAGSPGVIVVAAAGNEGKDPIRAEGTISQGATQSVTFNWGASVTAAQRIELWYPGSNEYAVRVNGPGGCTTGFHLAGATNTYNLACGSIEITSTGVQANNDDRQIEIRFTPANPVANSQGAWSVDIRGDVVAQANTPFSLICGEDGGGLLFTSNTSAVTTQILTDTSSATRTIAVAAYNTNYSWTSLGGNPFTAGGAGPLGDVSDFSSRGPRRNCSNLAKCPQVFKPEITAPGALIMSALGQDAAVPNDGTTEADGKHVAYNGTSMATPHVSGAVALMLQKNPTLTPEQVKQILFSSVQTNAFSTGLPNNAWGNGILDAQAAVMNTPALSRAKFDFNMDARSDILWRNDTTGENYIYPMNGTAILPSEGFIRSVPTPWTVAGSGDFNGDGRADILWRNTATGENYIYFMDGRAILPNEGYIRSVPTIWVVDGVADFDGDAKADILWRNTTTGENYIYFMDGRVIKPNEGFIRSVPLVWAPVAVGDFDGDARADILWRHGTTGENYIYFMDGRVIKPNEGFIRSVPTNWVAGGSGDFDGDGRADILWRNTTNGENYIYFMDGRVIKPNEGYIRSVATVWIPASVADFDGDGRADILWRNTGNGQNYVYPMDGRVIKPSEGFTRSVPTAWSVMTK